MALAPSDREQLVRDGYLLLPGAAPRARVESALAAINGSLGARGLPPDRLPEMRARSFCTELVSAPEILDLYTATAVREAAEAAIGPVRAPTQGQIALRFPQPAPAGPAWPHIDGMHSPDNGVPAGTLWHFTALAAVFLSDVAGPGAGNFTVWPGSHRLVEAEFQRRGPTAFSNGFPSLPLGEPRPILARAGDALIAHYALAHGVGPNVGAHIRYAVFFRLFHARHEEAGTKPMTDLWHEWEGVKAV